MQAVTRVLMRGLLDSATTPEFLQELKNRKKSCVKCEKIVTCVQKGKYDQWYKHNKYFYICRSCYQKRERCKH